MATSCQTKLLVFIFCLLVSLCPVSYSVSAGFVASPSVGVREDDGDVVSSEASSFYLVFACFSVSCKLCLPLYAFCICICRFRGFINLKLGFGLMFNLAKIPYSRLDDRIQFVNSNPGKNRVRSWHFYGPDRPSYFALCTSRESTDLVMTSVEIQRRASGRSINNQNHTYF
jgi:hypothetical protein